MNKLEKVALRYTLKNGRPIVLVFNSMSSVIFAGRYSANRLHYHILDSDIHLLPNNEEGYAMIHQLQQRAEAWAEAVRATFLMLC